MALSYGKWTKYKIMKELELLHPYLPETAIFSKKILWEFLKKFEKVVIKPSLGYGGKGITQISQLKNNRYEIHHWYKKLIVNSRREVIDYLKENHFKRKYIIQEKIPMVKIKQAPFDLRIMVQRKKGSFDWKVTGKMAKVAANGFIITNAAKKVLTIEKALQSVFTQEGSVEMLIDKIDEISLLTATHLQKYYKKNRRIGFDIAIDHEGNIWIIEANLTPSIAMFNRLKDKSMLQEIKRYKRG